MKLNLLQGLHEARRKVATILADIIARGHNSAGQAEARRQAWLLVQVPLHSPRPPQQPASLPQLGTPLPQLEHLQHLEASASLLCSEVSISRSPKKTPREGQVRRLPHRHSKLQRHRHQQVVSCIQIRRSSDQELQLRLYKAMQGRHCMTAQFVVNFR